MTTSRHRRALCVALLLLLTLPVSPVGAQKKPVMIPFENEDRAVPWARNRLGRFFQSNQWSRLDELSRNALEVAVASDLKDLKTEAQWYRTLVLAQKGASPEEVFESLRMTVDYGYRSIDGIESADQLAVIRADPTTEPKFRALLQKLRDTVADEAQASFRSVVDGQVAKLGSITPESLGVHSLRKPDGGNVAEAGRPMVIVLSRTYHAGFRKQWPVLESAVAPLAERVTPLALFYENDARSEFILGEVARFAKVAGVGENEYAVIDRAGFKELRDAFSRLHDQLPEDATRKPVFDLYFPFTFIVDGAGRPLFSASGNLDARQIAYALEKTLAGLPVPEKPATEEKAAEEAEDSDAKPEDAKPGESAASSEKAASEKEADAPEKKSAEPETESEEPSGDEEENPEDGQQESEPEKDEASDASREADRTF